MRARLLMVAMWLRMRAVPRNRWRSSITPHRRRRRLWLWLRLLIAQPRRALRGRRQQPRALERRTARGQLRGASRRVAIAMVASSAAAAMVVVVALAAVRRRAARPWASTATTTRSTALGMRTTAAAATVRVGSIMMTMVVRMPGQARQSIVVVAAARRWRRVLLVMVVVIPWSIQRCNRLVVVLIASTRRARNGRKVVTIPIIIRGCTSPERSTRQGATFMRELVRARPRMRALKKTTFVTELKYGFLILISMKNWNTYHFSWAQIGPSPGGSVGGAAVEAPPANTVCELCGSVISEDCWDLWLAAWDRVPRIIGVHGTWVLLWVWHWWYSKMRETRRGLVRPIVVLLVVAGLVVEIGRGLVDIGRVWHLVGTWVVVSIGWWDHWRIVLVRIWVDGRRRHWRRSSYLRGWIWWAVDRNDWWGGRVGHCGDGWRRRRVSVYTGLVVLLQLSASVHRRQVKKTSISRKGRDERRRHLLIDTRTVLSLIRSWTWWHL